MKPKFHLGDTFITPNAADNIDPADALAALDRHILGDWGECSRDECDENEQALRDGTRLRSIYRSKTGLRFQVVTELDRSTTTIRLMPANGREDPMEIPLVEKYTGDDVNEIIECDARLMGRLTF